MKETSIAPTRATVLALALTSGLGASLVTVRALGLGQPGFLFFFLNLFLAWVPLLAALPLCALLARQARRPFTCAALGAVWFLFFPYAPYLVTNLVDLRKRTQVPYWFDMITIMTLAVTGLFLGYFSLHLVQEQVRRRFGRRMGWGFAMGILGLSAFGIYLGRFVRWNLWDVLRSPLSTLREIASLARKPEALAFSATFFAFLLTGYLVIQSIIHLRAPVEPAPPRV